MTGRQRRRAPPPDYTPGTLLDWRDSTHWSNTPKACRYCDGPTNLRDSKRSPAHKTCAEQALAQQAADTEAAYHLWKEPDRCPSSAPPTSPKSNSMQRPPRSRRP